MHDVSVTSRGHLCDSTAFLFCSRFITQLEQDALLSQGETRDAAVNFDTYRISQWHRAVSLPLATFLYTSVTVQMLKLHTKPKITARDQNQKVT